MSRCIKLCRHALLVSAFALCAGTSARAETLAEALALAYANNPQINAQRAATRAIDENVPIAKSGLRPLIFGSADISKTRTEITGNPNPLVNRTTIMSPGGFGVTISQTLFDGFKTQNNVAAAQAAVYASRETLRNTVQNVLFDAASAYMDVIRDQAVVSLRGQSLEFLNEQVRSERARFDVGESTRTDVAQAEASQAGALAQLNIARANLKSSIAIYRQVVGMDPRNLTRPAGVGKLLPRSLDAAFAIAFEEHPAILASKFLVDQADWNVKSAESDLLPSVTVEGSRSRRFEDYHHGGQVTDSSSITAKLTVPIYQGGAVYGKVRQNKETLGQRWIEVDQSVDSVRAAVVSAYSQLQSAQDTVRATDTQIRAANLALQGAVEERNVGQRTTLDVLNTQQSVIDAQLDLVAARRDVIVAGYALLSAIGRLDENHLGLAVAKYEPADHYNAVRDKWFGLRTPDGR
ncbi:MAG: TolC family outer membrane protein [Pseudomonadota bacterium]|nr:TolC family outer membrane protein [Pseudomonadota bacterium]